jgi:hypothetical protein
MSRLAGRPVVQLRRIDCEDRQRSPKGAGLWLVTASVTPGMTGFVPCCDLSARGHRPRPGLEELA